MNAAEILERAKAAYHAAERNYRDALLETGRLLHEYVLERLREAAGMREWTRLQHGLSRRKCIEDAAKKLKTTPKRINSLIGTAQVPLLLGITDLGGISHVALYRFKCFLRRLTGGRQAYMGRTPDLPVANAETWEVRPEFKERAASLLRQAIAENWIEVRTRGAAKDLFAEFTSKLRRPQMPKWQGPVETVQKSMKKASPGDVAQTCMRLVEAAEDPAAVALRLRIALEKYLPKKRKAFA
jgi:hypothetical protein